MGYKPASVKVTKITYSDFPGLEVYAVAPSMGELMDIADMKPDMNVAAEKRMLVFELFSRYIRSWNVEHPEPTITKLEIPEVSESVVCARCGLAEDMPVPTLADSMMCLPIDFIMPVFFGWLSTVSRVDPTKYLNLNNGGMNTPGDLMQRLANLQNPMPSDVPNLNLDYLKDSTTPT